MVDQAIRLWNLSEDESGAVISAPQTVSFMLQMLREQGPFEWHDLVWQAGKYLKFPIEMIEKQDDSTPLQVLAALWARHVFPGRSKARYLDFGQVVAEVVLDMSFGSANASQKRAYQAAGEIMERIRDQPEYTGAGRISTVLFVIADVIL